MQNISSMSTLFSVSTTPNGQSFRWKYWIMSLALISGLILSILSWLEVCVEHCSANQDYRLWGIPFAVVGVIFFPLLLVLHFISRVYQNLSWVVGWLVMSALGAEIMFIAVQKYQIGHWCPVCLSIANSVAIAAFLFITECLKHFKTTSQLLNRGGIMPKVKQFFTPLSFLLLGFFTAFIGIGKINPAEAAVNDIKERIAFGLKNSPVEVYYVSDWFCPSCKKVEPLLQKMYPKIRSQATVYFVDYPIHRQSLNFTPYNLAFLINSKSHYFQARNLLSQLADQTETPNDEEVERAAQRQGIHFKELSFLDVEAGIKYFDQIVNKYNLNSTPTIIITNPHKGKTVKFEGRDEISEEKVLQTLEKMRQ